MQLLFHSTDCCLKFSAGLIIFQQMLINFLQRSNVEIIEILNADQTNVQIVIYREVSNLAT